MDRNTGFYGKIVVETRSLSARRAWIEIARRCGGMPGEWSLSARRAWIEIIIAQPVPYRGPVALRKESVDRNYAQLEQMLDDKVALRKESVDRNRMRMFWAKYGKKSLSARRAWIEISFQAMTS